VERRGERKGEESVREVKGMKIEKMHARACVCARTRACVSVRVCVRVRVCVPIPPIPMLFLCIHKQQEAPPFTSHYPPPLPPATRGSPLYFPLSPSPTISKEMICISFTPSPIPPLPQLLDILLTNSGAACAFRISIHSRRRAACFKR
jgi:hypothetical protein